MKKSKNRWIKLQMMLLVFTFGLFLNQTQMQVSAAEEKTGISSDGSIVYKSSTSSAAIYVEDIALLQEKLCRVRAEIYDPASYGSVCQRESTAVAESAYAENRGQYDSLDVPDNRLIVASESQEPPEDAAEAGAEAPEQPKKEAETGAEAPESPEDTTEPGAETPEPPEDTTEPGAETPEPPENAAEPGAETPELPEDETETGVEAPKPPEGETETGAEAPVAQEAEQETEGGNE